MLEQFEFTPSHSTESRSVWVQHSMTGSATTGLLFLDAELYIQRVNAPDILANMQTQQQLRNVAAVYISSIDAAARHRDLVCHSAFPALIAGEIMPWLSTVVEPPANWILCGLSLSGLCAAYINLTSPGLVLGAVCQSPSAWWNDEWLTEHVRSVHPPRSRYWISVGNQETEENVTHPPSGMRQKVNQRDSCQRLAAALEQSGSAVQYAEYTGGHDPACWAQELPAALQWISENASPSSAL